MLSSHDFSEMSICNKPALVLPIVLYIKDKVDSYLPVAFRYLRHYPGPGRFCCHGAKSFKGVESCHFMYHCACQAWQHCYNVMGPHTLTCSGVRLELGMIDHFYPKQDNWPTYSCKLSWNHMAIIPVPSCMDGRPWHMTNPWQTLPSSIWARPMPTMSCLLSMSIICWGLGGNPILWNITGLELYCLDSWFIHAWIHWACSKDSTSPVHTTLHMHHMHGKWPNYGSLMQYCSRPWYYNKPGYH